MDKQSLTHKTHLIAGQTGLPFNAVMTHFFLEVILSRIAVSKGCKNFIFKGGFLLSNILGIKSRTTVDIDLLVIGIDMTEESVKTLVNQALKQQVTPEVSCEIQSVEPIRDEDQYGGYRVRIMCGLENIRQVVPLDLATGDPITPEAIQYEYNPLFPGKPIQISSYNIETILAEKIETVYQRGLANSRFKDFYDIHIIWKVKHQSISNDVLKEAFTNTCSHRLTKPNKNEFNCLLEVLKSDDQMAKRWRSYLKRNAYAREIEFDDTLSTMIAIIPLLFE
ncbi:MAG: nucleotidyl transferase AbiEii/AbiGii toxin family protein [Chloroflexota bacterium]|nr:nucleotidyl transferase AbiEii/AbiGii toxin family protein [Chloroflexota bacterium]